MGTASFFEPWTGRIVRRFPATHDFYYLDDHALPDRLPGTGHSGLRSGQGAATTR